MKRKLFFTLAFILSAYISGYASLYINEVNSTGKWIEIYNDGASAANVGGYFVERNNNDGTSAAIALPDGTTIASKGFLVIYQGTESGGTSASPCEGAIDCQTFGISSTKFMTAILKDDQGYDIDIFDIGDPQTVAVSSEKSWARETDGATTIVALDPTPGKSNSSPATPPSFSDLKLYVNEVNSDGKWIEIYNDETSEVNVGGFTVTRNNNDGATSIATLPAGTVIASKGFLVIYQGTGSGGTALPPCDGAIDCLTYGISSSKFWNAILKDSEGNIVDNTFDVGNPQTVGVSGGTSWARKTDGSATIVALDPTPGKTNSTPPPYSDLKIFVNEVNSTGKWIELYNDEATEVSVGGFTVTRNNNDGASSTATLPDGTTIAPKGFLVIYQGTESGGTALSPCEGAIDCQTYGISSSKFWNAILRDSNKNIVDDSFDIGNPQTVTVSGEKSWARETDGVATIVSLDPTPGFRNDGQSGIAEIYKPENSAYVSAGILIAPENTSWIQLYNASGILVLSKKVKDASIDLTNLPKGFYIVKFTNSGKPVTQKIVL